MTLLSRNVRFMRIFVDFLGRGVGREWGCPQLQLSEVSLSVSSETLRIRPAFLYSNMESLVGFPVISKYITNDLEWLFRVRPWLHVKQNICKNVLVFYFTCNHLLSSTCVQHAKTFAKMFCKYFATFLQMF